MSMYGRENVVVIFELPTVQMATTGEGVDQRLDRDRDSLTQDRTCRRCHVAQDVEKNGNRRNFRDAPSQSHVRDRPQ